MSSRRPRSLFEPLPSPGSLKINGLSVDDLANLLRCGVTSDIVIFDFRKYDRYAANHIISAESLEKLSSHQGSLTSSLGPSSARNALTELVSQFRDVPTNKKFVLYDEDSNALKDCAVFILPLVEHLLAARPHDVYLLRGGFHAFVSQYPNLCTPEDVLCIRLSPGTDLHDSNSLPVQSPSQTSPNSGRKLGFYDKTNMPRAASMLVISPDHAGPDFCSFLPSAILSHLYIGSEFDAKDIQFLTSQNITHVLNVTTHIPCFYENLLHYKRLPACDTDNDNIKQYFDEASEFIDSAERTGGRVLVHCQAGISRSPSIVLAYLIGRKNMEFSEAYQLIARVRPIIAPNFNFLAQLHEFEQEVTSRRSYSEVSTSTEVSSSSDFDDQDPYNNSCGNASTKNNLLVPLPPKRCRIISHQDSPTNPSYSAAESCFL